MICCSSSAWTFHCARRQALSQNSSQSISRAVMKLCLSKSSFRSQSLSFNPLMNIWFVFVRLSACGFAFVVVCDSERHPSVLLSNLWRHNYLFSLLFACLCECIVIFKFFSDQECKFVCTTSGFCRSQENILFIHFSLTQHNSQMPSSSHVAPFFSCSFPFFWTLPLILASCKSCSRFTKDTKKKDQRSY